jgi:hypothetical protein
MRVLALVLCALCVSPVQLDPSFTPSVSRPQKSRANELTLAGIRPGRDTLAAEQKKFPPGLTAKAADSVGAQDAVGIPTWTDCRERTLSLEVDAADRIQSVDIEAPRSQAPLSCGRPLPPERFWSTGRGLRLNDSRERVLAIYGAPGSRGPSVKNGRELELLYYAFDWAGPDVPQVMEISCERSTGRVVEILLAAPSL